MLYQFKSKATGDLIMLEPNGRRILEIMGKVPDSRGIIQTFQIPDAIAAIEAAIVEEQAQTERIKGSAQAVILGQELGGEAAGVEAVSLRQRALPMLKMLRRCQQAQVDIVWGV